LADLKHNPEKKGVWVNEPYVDPAGRGWMISAIAPSYYNNKLVGVPGLDVTIQTITSKYIVNKQIFIIDPSGVIVAADEFVIKLLSLPDLVDHKYFETIKTDTYLKDKYNLLMHKDRSIRNLFVNMTKENTNVQQVQIKEKNYQVIFQNIDELEWKLVKIINVE